MPSLAPGLMGIARNRPPVLPHWFDCDAIDAPACALLSTARRLRAAYTGPAFRIVRASDGTSRDIGFTGRGIGLVDVAAIDSFCSGTVGRVDLVYDQSGSARNATQVLAAPASIRPAAYNAGRFGVRSVPAIQTDGGPNGATMSYSTGLAAGTSPALTVIYAAQNQGAAAYASFFLNLGLNSTSGAVLTLGGTYTAALAGSNASQRGSYSGLPGNTFTVATANPNTYIWRHAQNANLDTDRLTVNGVDLVPTATGSQTLSLAGGNGRWFCQVDSGGTSVVQFQGLASCLLIYNGDLSGKNLAAAQTIAAAHAYT